MGVTTRDKLFAEWLEGYVNPEWMKAQSLIPHGIDLSLGSFRVFFEARRNLLVQELRKKMERLARGPTGASEMEVEELRTGEVDEAEP
ncbi:MAG: hypothetical protein ACRDHL_13295, partial [Candidatus Promineifilaceae bacterium]